MSDVKYIWHGPSALRHAQGKALHLVTEATTYAFAHIRQRINKSGVSRSVAGEYPHKDTGEFRESMEMEVQNTLSGPEGRVGTNDPVGKYLEFGTRRMRPRPWLSLASVELRALLTAVIIRKSK